MRLRELMVRTVPVPATHTRHGSPWPARPQAIHH
jgi:hypothetical protein